MKYWSSLSVVRSSDKMLTSTTCKIYRILLIKSATWKDSPDSVNTDKAGLMVSSRPQYN